MSRVGKKPIPVPDKTTVAYEDRVLTVQGEKGALTRPIHRAVDLQMADGTIHVTVLQPNRRNVALQGMTRALVANMVTGVSQGFQRDLEINGIGYRVELNGSELLLHLGYSHPINFTLPDGISASLEKRNVITLRGIDKELLGATAAKIRSFRPPEPYKGKGIKYAEENIRRKAGKAGTK